ncbi:hypothetical protein GCT13_39925 [Paraburkholderia sp. CNPSo 3157]|uniref:Uncharacterized protein n=1 Tax=Paraburkholderia franconis TaxID=2654983 RepID=A0A7X1NJU4_9BURK|nr:hypothetical protein [Paraburkholderia franconis]MPW22808.1 hypothetical protein [Paraburkholderia franconis]
MTARSLRSSRRTILRASGGIAAGAAIGGLDLLNSNRARATGSVNIRPISDFLDVQGTFCAPNPSGGSGCFLFVPPAPNFLGFNTVTTNQTSALFGALDYAGLANAYCSKAFNVSNVFGTTIGANSTVIEEPLADGTARVRVLLYTQHANTWVIKLDLTTDTIPQIANTQPTLFGLRPPAPPQRLDLSRLAFGDSFFDIVFINTAPGAPLVDLISLAPPALQFIAFRARASGPLTAAFGVPDGTPGSCNINQSGLVATSSVANPKSRVALDAFPAELVDLHVVGR